MKARSASALMLLLLTALIAQGACLPHTHSGVGSGVYNGEHDLTLLATTGTVAPLPVIPLLFVDEVTAPVVTTIASAPADAVTRDAESRAPPAA
jgi:hypothetical protein